MKLIVGLGNPGEKYAYTRHNIGFQVVERLAHEIMPENISWSEDSKHKAMIAKSGDIILAKPLTFMNNAGFAVKSILDYYKMTPADAWVIHDDIDLPLGKIRIRTGGGSAGHHGVDSIIAQLAADTFVRFRLGVGRGAKSGDSFMDKNVHHKRVIEFVLSRFRQNEAGDLKHLVKKGEEAVRLSLEKGLDRAMNTYN